MATYQQEETKKPPILYTGFLNWFRKNLFSSAFNSVLTVLILALLIAGIPPLLNWFFWDATFSANTANECTNSGACWAYVIEKFNLYIYGFYPEELRWRPNLALLILFAIVVGLNLVSNVVYKRKLILLSFCIYPIVAFFLMYGGFWLKEVTTDEWGGLLLTLIIASTGIIVSFPISIILALGRRSKMPIIRYLSIIYIEFIRGVPLISILFMASVLLPLFFEEGTNVDKLLRALIGITLFQAAYLAEVIRGGLQSIPKGQYEAADAMGFGYVQKMVFIILPQALKVSIPNIVGSSIGLFKDTTLVLIIGLFDMLAMVRLTSSDTNWLGMETEGYIFVTMIFWVILYNMSKYAGRLEKRFNTAH